MEKSIVIVEKSKEIDNYRLFPSVRLFMFFLAFLATTVLSGGFAAFNFALVCMVNETAIAPAEERLNSTWSSDQCGGNLADDFSSANGYDGEFAWDKATQASLIAAYAIGAVLPNVPTGLLADRYGCKIIFFFGALVSAISSALTPMAAYAGFGWVFAARFLLGIGVGSSWPACLAMVARWGSPSDTGTLIGLIASGYQMGPLIAMITSSMICDSRFRWPFIFYFWALLDGVFLIIWLIFYANEPRSCRFISAHELEYLEKNSLSRADSKKQSLSTVPWRKVFYSPSVLGIYACQFCTSWTNFFINEFMPAYSKEVLYFNVRSNGVTAALPSLGQVVGRMMFGLLGDKITFGGRSKTFSVRFFSLLCTAVPGICFFVSAFLDCRFAILAVAMFAIASLFLAGSSAGYLRGGVLMAAPYSGLIGSIGNIAGYSAGIVMPYTTGAILKSGTVGEWRTTLFLTAAVLAVGGVQYVFVGTAKEQEWAKKKKSTPNKVFTVQSEDNPIRL